MDSLHAIFYWNRLKLLQSISTSFTQGDEEIKLDALVFIPGPDGRNNSMAIRVLKYLFKGAIGADLFDDTLDNYYEALEDIILIIEEHSVRIIYTESMKKVISNIISIFPNIIEYTYLTHEEEDIDQFQLKKCFQFKKAILEILPNSGNIGIAVPIGYDNIIDIESWPLLQSFALDEIFTPTGFFTARYNVVDITTQLETIFRVVDCFYVENAAGVVNGAINQHMSQFLSVLDATTVNQRDRLTADEAISPLEVLYEFGEMDAAVALEQSLKPVLLFGPFSNFVGNAVGPKAGKWREFIPANSLHAVVEASEPATGIRWCRTYFLQQGTSSIIYQDALKLQSALSGISIQSLQGENEEEDEQVLEELKTLSSSSSSALTLPSTASQSALQRLMSLYVKLWFNLRTLVFETFLQENDVLAAAELIQQKLTQMMSISSSSANSVTPSGEQAALEAINLFPHEKLQLHMDCLNALGEIVSVNDVDDMGGVCWTYIRASIHGVLVPLGNQETAVTIAVGDTFLFSPLSKGRFDRSRDWRYSSAGGNLLPFVNDAVCITHNIPYFQAFVGGGVEEEYLRLILYCSKTSMTSSPLNLGKPVEVSGTNSMNVIVLTNHSIQPCFTSELKIFQEGFIITKINHLTSAPIPIHYNQDDVKQIWTIDTAECFEEALRSLDKYHGSGPGSSAWRDMIYDQYDVNLPRGILIIMELKNNRATKNGGGALNALHQALPIISLQSSSQENGSASVIALLFPHNDRAGSMVPTILERWRPALRMNDVEEFKGKASYGKINREILWSYLVFLDSLQLFAPSSPTLNPESASMTMTVASKAREILGNSLVASREERKDAEEKESGDEESYPSEFGKILSFVNEFSIYGYPAYGSYPMRCIHAVAEARRLSSFDYSPLLFPREEDLKARDSRRNEAAPFQILVINGLFGTGVNIVAKQFTNQLLKASADLLDLTQSTRASMFEVVSIDLSDFLRLHNTEDLQEKEEKEIGKLLNSFLQEKLKDAAQRLTSAKRNVNLNKGLKAVLILSIVTTPSLFFPFERLLETLIAITRAPITHVTTIVTPESILQSPSSQTSENSGDKVNVLDLFRGIGHETWQGKGFETLHNYSSQSVILLESISHASTGTTANAVTRPSNTAYQAIKQHINRYQYNLVFLLRLSSFHIFFEEEDLQFYQRLLFPPALLPPSSSAMLTSTNNALAETIAAESTPLKQALGLPTFEDVKESGFENRGFAVKLSGLTSSSQAEVKKTLTRRPYPVLQVLHYSNKQLFSNQTRSDRQYFSLTLFLQLIQKLFPTAHAMFTNITFDWQHANHVQSNQEGEKKVPLFLQHAMKKVLQQREFKEMSQNYRKGFADLQKQEKKRNNSSSSANSAVGGGIAPPSSLWQHIQSNVISLQAILVIDNERIQNQRGQKATAGSYRVLIEANRGNILYRELSDDVVSVSSSEIRVIGTFDQTQEAEEYLLSLFQLTQQHYLAPKPLLTAKDFLSEAEAKTMRGLSSDAPPYDLQKVFRVQNLSKYQDRPMPPGFWYDGQFFVDHNGQRFEVRPDIAEILEHYIDEENKKRNTYNQWLTNLYL